MGERQKRGHVNEKSEPLAAIHVDRPSTHSLKYRADIDGLRALAVLSVVLYHAEFPHVTGGFVGVDIFFVISGYLIGQIILEELHVGRFSLATFYERRVRRIVPALAVMILAVVAASGWLLYPQDMKDAAYSLLATTFSVSNFYFMATTDYFGDEVSTKPLLHTWSLGVEEQFYIFFPLFMMLVIRKWPRRRNPILLILFVLSLSVSVVSVFQYPIMTFYAPYTRAWELLSGTLLAAGIFQPLRNKLAANILAAVGLLLAVAPVFLYNRLTVFPGLSALPPVLGALLIIYAGSHISTWVSRLASLWPVVFIGQISYSLYLWHWPVLQMLYVPMANLLSATHIISGLHPWMIRVGLVVLSIVLATASWQFVEKPFRKKHDFDRHTIYRVASAAALGFCLLAVSAIATEGWQDRYSPQALRMVSYVTYTRPGYREGTCFLTSDYAFSAYKPDVCLKMSSSLPNYLLIGDSHGAHLWYGLSHTLHANVMQATSSGCKPVLEQPVTAEARCRRLMESVFHDFLRNHKVDMLVISARWTLDDIPPLSRTIDWLNQHHQRVLILGPIIQYQYALPYILAAADGKPDVSALHNLQLGGLDDVDRAMARMSTQKRVAYGSTYHALCRDDGNCTTLAPDGAPVQFDYSHLTNEGSLLVANALEKSGAFR